MKRISFKKLSVAMCVSLVFSGVMVATTLASKAANNDFFDWGLQTTTPLEKTDSSYKLLAGDYNADNVQDMYIIKKKGESNKTEVHVLDGASNYQTFTQHVATCLDATDDNFDFMLGDYNKDGKLDVYAIKKTGETDSTELHILNGADNFQSYLLETGTSLHPTSDYEFEFELGDYDKDGALDIYAISKKGGSNTTEVHILTAASGFKDFAIHTTTALHMTDGSYEFEVGYYNDDDSPDIIMFKKQGATDTTEVHVLNGADNFQSFIFQCGTVLHQTDDNFEFSINKTASSYPDIYVYSKQAGTECTEIHRMRFLNGGNPCQVAPEPIATEAPKEESQSEESAPAPAAATTGQAQAIVDMAASQIGTSEDGGWTKYGAWWDDRTGDSGFAYAAWCAMFVSWCGNQAGIDESQMGYYAYCPYWVNWFKDNGIWNSRSSGYTPKTGDIILFDWDVDGLADHVGLVNYAADGYVYTIEGNSNNSVRDRSYDLSYGCIMGYGAPNYN